LTLAEAIAVFAAGVAAGSINAVVGSGSLITFPTLLAFGVPPVLANVSNNVGLVPGGASGAYGYRHELAGQRGRLLRLGIASAIGAAAGAVLLLTLPASTFQVIVPVLILIACTLVVVQPWLNRWLAGRRTGTTPPHGGPVLFAGVCASGVYGGYFGAAQGVLMIGLLGTFLDESLQRVNALKNGLTGIVNGVAAIVFIAVTHVDWLLAALIAVGSTIGGFLGARYGRRLPPLALRILVVLIGLVSAVKLLFF
jgi:uncharacterized protein